jgi:DNA-binding NarL/FixJ family response regulator
MLCLVSRDGDERAPAGLTRLADDAGTRIDLGALGAAEVAELARRAYGRPVPARAAARLATHAGGNPLHTSALLDELPYEVLVAADAEELPAPRSYASLVLAQVARCSEPARNLAAALAVLGAAAPMAAVARMVCCDDPLAAVDELAACGLVDVRSGVTGTTVAFPHGLARASVAADLSPSRRAALHAAAATVTEGDEALGHRLAASHGPDPDLVRAARHRADALAAAAPVAAGRLLLAAASRAGSTDEREHLLALAAARLSMAGAPVDGLVDEVATGRPGALRSVVLGRAALTAGDQGGAERLLTDAWQAASTAGSGDDARPLAAPIADLLGILALHRRDSGSLVTWARRAVDAGSRSGLSATLGAHGLALEGRFAEAVAEMSDLLSTAPSPELRLDALLGRGVARVWANDLERADADLVAVDADGGPARSLLARVDVRSYRAEAAFRAGRWPEALDLAESTASIVDDAGDPLPVALPHAVAVFVLAGMGRLPEARHHLEAAWANAEQTGLMPARLWSTHASLRLAVAAGDHDDVVRVGDGLVAEGFGELPEAIHHWRAAYVDGLVAVDRLDAAAAAARELGREAARGDVSVAADAARAAGVVAAARGDHDGATDAFAAGLALDTRASRPYERARLELAAGAHQRRAGNRRAASALLDQACRRFEALGAGPWVTRCAQEAAACGLRPRRRSSPVVGDEALTSQERLVARLVAQGATNREVAAELVISVKTVEHHLGRVYAKLGLRSRTELAARLAADGAEAVAAGERARP